MLQMSQPAAQPKSAPQQSLPSFNELLDNIQRSRNSALSPGREPYLFSTMSPASSGLLASRSPYLSYSPVERGRSSPATSLPPPLRVTSPVAPSPPGVQLLSPASTVINEFRMPSPAPSTESSNEPIKKEKRRHVCNVCSRYFTTSGHLARHNRIHTGEKRYECPWPSCDARFARQDNCMQHYKTHTNGKRRATKRHQ
ncbi:Piso0_002301 [Millerozyma farinosa CBS 7064]|uniref:Piso0_002301 protein n=1 Tax=Pichia sorbitophila (strain ATCC MYA-4447 / BCRC 22081 / CBS 7064 / NBRC 10061 / NRRL Y-12695) TaxID=559304 RepID=G8YC90_PICSO|nr:Piso0_002301 [Millerozyma farinosa CBS 7064]